MEDPKSTFRQFPRLDPEMFKVNERPADVSIADWIQRNRITDEEREWVAAQPLCGRPSLKRLRATFQDAGFEDIDFELKENREDLNFSMRLTAKAGVADSEQLLQVWIRILRCAGFDAGYSEVGFRGLDGAVLRGSTFTDTIDNVCENGPPIIELEND